MHRRRFLEQAGWLSSFATLSPVSQPPAALVQIHNPAPPFLAIGDTLAITCPAGHVSREEIQPALQILESWGFRVRVGQTIGKRDFSFGGTDMERAADMQALLDDPAVKAIISARGGYGITRMIDRLRFDRFKASPKWLIGFSDITALHLHLYRNGYAQSIHSKMCNSFPENWDQADPQVRESLQSIFSAITGTRMQYTTVADARNRTGVATGNLVGGNLAMICHLLGTRSEPDTRGAILFLEETGEYLYSIDRMFVQLQRTGKLEGLAGLILGGFRIKPDDPGEEFGRNLYDIVWEKVEPYSYPLCFGFPVGHQKHNMALKCGASHVLTVQDDIVQLSEATR